MKYPKEYLDEIKLRLKVSQVVSKSVQLKKRGKEFVGLSPFNNEKTPSFTVSDEKEFYHCFSTGEHGNIFDFVMKTRSVGFGEAVKSLAAEAGMPPYRFSNFDEKKERKFLTYKSIYKDYLNFFSSELFKEYSQEALNYLIKRGLTKNIIEEFKLGYVPWKNNFYEELVKKYSEEEIESTGLYYKHDKTGKFIDRFNSRIIFPINNLIHDTIAFGGRIIKDSKLAKYINSPETEFYKKGRMLFNLEKAKSQRLETDEVIIVEGYMDVLSLHAAGFKNVISNSGTAITEGQIELVWKFFPNPTVCLDGDKSGQKAAMRIAEKLFPLISENNKIYFSILPNGEDPDDYIKAKGKKKFSEFLKTKKIIQSYIWDIYSQEIKKDDPFAISKFEKRIKGLCFTIKDETLRKYILEDLLEKISNLTPIQNTQKNKSRFKNFKDFANKDFKILNETKLLHKQKGHLTKEQLKEYSILFLIINYPNSAKALIEELASTKLTNKECNNLKEEVISQLGDNQDQDQFKIKIDDKYKDLITEIKKNSNLLNESNKKQNEIEETLKELLLDLKEMNHLKKIEFLEDKLAQNLDESSYSELIKLKNQLNRD